MMALADRIHELSPTSQIVVHHDRKADTLPWDGAPPQWVHMVERVQVEWGDWSIVEVTLAMFQFAHEAPKAKWCAVVSGEHWPVVNLESWERHLAASGVDAYLPTRRLPRRLHFGPSDREGNRSLARCVHRSVTINEPRLKMAHKGLGGLWRLSRHAFPLCAIEYSHRRRTRFIGSPRRGRPTDLTFYKRSQRLGFNDRSAKTILNTQPPVTEWFMHGHIPDETFLQSVLYNAPGLTVRNELVTYVPEGPERPTAARWMVLDQDGLETVWQSRAAFARKVDPDDRPQILKAIDARVDRERGIGTTASGRGPVA